MPASCGVGLVIAPWLLLVYCVSLLIHALPPSALKKLVRYDAIPLGSWVASLGPEKPQKIKYTAGVFSIAPP